MPTATGSYDIGIRRGWSQWQKDLPAVCRWAKQNGFASVDLNVATDLDMATVTAAGLSVGTVDLLNLGEITHPDAGKRQAVVDQNLAYIRQCAEWGATRFFTVVGGDGTRKRAENYATAVEAFAPLAALAAELKATIAVEGYPGGPPHYALLCTTPETTRAFFKDLPRGVGLNYDPSHLIRLGVDHVRFLKEFADKVVHVHGKDTELFPDALYEFGLYQPAAFTPSHAFGQHVWRYTIPGRGTANWPEIFRVLKSVDYAGGVGIELEDENFNGSEAGEKEGFSEALRFLTAQ